MMISARMSITNTKTKQLQKKTTLQGPFPKVAKAGCQANIPAKKDLVWAIAGTAALTLYNTTSLKIWNVKI